MLIVSSILAPALCVTGRWRRRSWLTVTQTLGRPVGIALLLLVGIVAAEEMPRNSRAYAVSVVAMAGGLGAGLCVVALPLADLGERGWRLVYVVPLAFLVVAWDLWRRMPETRRFEAPHITAPPLQRRRFVLLAASELLTNLLVAPQSFFNNRYLKDVRNYSAAKISLFTLCTNTPGVGIVAGEAGRLQGRRLVGPSPSLALVFTVIQFSVGRLADVGVVDGGGADRRGGPRPRRLRRRAVPDRQPGQGQRAHLVAGLVGSSIGLPRGGGWALDQRSDQAITLLAIGPVIVVGLVLCFYPETAARELEDLNPEDQMDGLGSSSEAAQPAGHG